MPDKSFIENLRLNNIFPAQGNPKPLIGMPDFNAGRQVPPYFGVQQQPTGIQEIAQRQAPTSIVKPVPAQQGPELNYEYKAPESDKFATNIIMGGSDKDKALASAERIAGVKNVTAGRGLDIKQQMANIANYKAKNPGLKALMPKGGNVTLYNPATGEMTDTGVDTGTLSEQDKLDLMAEQAQGLEGTRQAGRMQLQGEKQKGSLAQIGARAASNEKIAGFRAGTPTQNIAATRDAILKIQSTRPDLAPFLVKDPTTGQLNIDPNTPLDKLSQIQQLINPAKDIELPSSSSITSPSGSTTTKTPTSKTPTAADLIKKYGG